MIEKIGVGIVTTGSRPEQLDRCFGFFKYAPTEYDNIVVVVDGGDIDVDNLCDKFKGGIDRFTLIKNDTNLGVGKSKNKALRHLLDQGCDHIFLIEDDIHVKRSSVLREYIKASKKTGIQHFNFSQHGMMNKTFDGNSTPNPRMIIDYKDIRIPLYPHCVGAFSYYSRHCLLVSGLMDEKYYNACEHVDHTYQIIKDGMHPPFWHFADIENSWEYLGDEEWSLKQSTISSRKDHNEIVEAADKVFFEKHKHLPGQTPLTLEEDVIQSIKEIKKNYERE